MIQLTSISYLMMSVQLWTSWEKKRGGFSECNIVIVLDCYDTNPEANTSAFLYFHSGLTAALPCGPALIGNQDVAHVGKVLTELNLMTYDLHGKLGILDILTSAHSPISSPNSKP